MISFHWDRLGRSTIWVVTSRVPSGGCGALVIRASGVSGAATGAFSLVDCCLWELYPSSLFIVAKCFINSFGVGGVRISCLRLRGVRFKVHLKWFCRRVSQSELGGEGKNQDFRTLWLFHAFLPFPATLFGSGFLLRRRGSGFSDCLEGCRGRRSRGVCIGRAGFRGSGSGTATSSPSWYLRG